MFWSFGKALNPTQRQSPYTIAEPVAWLQFSNQPESERQNLIVIPSDSETVETNPESPRDSEEEETRCQENQDRSKSDDTEKVMTHT